MKKLFILFMASGICSMFNCIMLLVEGDLPAAIGWFVASYATLLLCMILRGISRPERLERGEYESPSRHQEDDPTVKKELTDSTCKESLPVGLTKREWFAGMAMAGEIAGFLAGEREVNGEERGIPTVIAEDAVLFADALIAELEKNNENHE